MAAKIDEEQLFYLKQDNVAESINWGVQTSHLITPHYLLMEPDCDSYTLCNKLLPDRENPRVFLAIKSHPDQSKSEKFCKSCLSLMDEYGEYVQDKKWQAAHAKFKAGQPCDNEPQLPPTLYALNRYLDALYRQVCKGSSFVNRDYEYALEKLDENNYGTSMKFRGLKVWSEVRTVNQERTGIYFTSFVLEPHCIIEKLDYLKVIDMLMASRNLRVSKDGKYIYQQQDGEWTKTAWPPRSRAVLKREDASSAFKIDFQAASNEELMQKLESKPKKPAYNSGNPKHPGYLIAEKINQKAKECFDKGLKVNAFGEEGLRCSFEGVKTSRSSECLTFNYKHGGFKCSTDVSIKMLANVDGSLKRGLIKVTDIDDEPFRVIFSL